MYKYRPMSHTHDIYIYIHMYIHIYIRVCTYVGIFIYWYTHTDACIQHYTYGRRESVKAFLKNYPCTGLRSPPRNATATWRMLLQCPAIAKAFANWTETLPSSKSCDTKTRTDIKNLLRTKVSYCSVVTESVVICQLTLKMAEEIDFENWRISNFKGLVTLTLDRVIWHTVVHHSLTSTYIPNFIGIGKTFCGRADGRTSEPHIEIIRSTLRSRPNKNSWQMHHHDTTQHQPKDMQHETLYTRTTCTFITLIIIITLQISFVFHSL